MPFIYIVFVKRGTRNAALENCRMLQMEICTEWFTRGHGHLWTSTRRLCRCIHRIQTFLMRRSGRTFCERSFWCALKPVRGFLRHRRLYTEIKNFLAMNIFIKFELTWYSTYRGCFPYFLPANLLISLNLISNNAIIFSLDFFLLGLLIFKNFSPSTFLLSAFIRLFEITKFIMRWKR